MQTEELCLGCMTQRENEAICSYCGWQHDAEVESLLYLPPGTILENKYLIGKVLGQGGFGITYLAWDMNLDIKLAIKEFFPQGLVTRIPADFEVTVYSQNIKNQYDFGLERFLNEAKTLARFAEHSNIVTVRDFFQARGTAYMVMNYLEGITLEKYLKQEGGIISFPSTYKIIMPVIDALREVHASGYMHRDISPDNIFIDVKGRVSLIDFGAARQDLGDKSKSVSVVIKAGYAPEEQYRSRGNQGPWTDEYAVAATLYRAITGQVPPESLERLVDDTLEPPSSKGIYIEKEAEKVLMKAMSVSIGERYQDMGLFQQALQEAFSAADSAANTPGNSSINPPTAPVAGSAKRSGSEPDLSIGPESATGSDSSSISETRAKRKEVYSGHRIDWRLPVFALGGVFFILLVVGAFIMDRGKDGAGSGIEEAAIYLSSDYDADYVIDNEAGDIPLSELDVGDRVVDPSWEWEHRLGPEDRWEGVPYSYQSGTTPSKAEKEQRVTWIVVAKDHYGEGEITLLAENIIGHYIFDNSTQRGSSYGSNHWGDSGTTDANHGIRKFLNGSVYTGNDANYYADCFFDAFSKTFQDNIIPTEVPCVENYSEKGPYLGHDYTTIDHVFLPSDKELNDGGENTHSTKRVWKYFQNATDAERVATTVNGNNHWYWTRSAKTSSVNRVRGVYSCGEIRPVNPSRADGGLRPALNLKSDVLVAEVIKE